MKKRRKELIFISCFAEIILIIFMSFAIAFINNENLVSAQIGLGSAISKLEGRIPVPSKAGAAASVDKDLNKGVLKEGITKVFTGESFRGSYIGTLVGALAWAGVAYGAVRLIGGFLGLDEGTVNAASYAAAAGAFTWSGLKFATEQQILGIDKIASNLGEYAGITNFVIGTAIVVAVFVLTYKKESKKLVTFQCLPFEPPLGGQQCEECNKDPFRPCSEYRCRSLGQACELRNVGTPEERCVWVSRDDVNSPTISPWRDALKPDNLAYIPDNTIRPPNRGVQIVSSAEDRCLPAFTPLEFGINLNEPSQCKLDYEIRENFEQMQFFFGGSNYFRYNHTQIMKLPGPDDTEVPEDGLAPEIENDGSFNLFVRCRDANGNENVDAFVFNYCVSQSPDTTPPIIEQTSIRNNGFVQFGSGETPIEIYVNEPSECKWSRLDKSYNDMENAMRCSTESFEVNARLQYTCKGNLTGIQDRQDNKFYFKCKDQPNKDDSERNVMSESFPLTLKGTQELNILEAKPNETISGRSDTISVNLEITTDDGAEEGKSICYFSRTGNTDSFIAMFQTNDFRHKQSLDLTGGDYEYFFRCIDAGGNTAEKITSFRVNVDKAAPIITRAYRDEGLKIITNEEAECVYSLTSCNYVFDEGIALIYSDSENKMNHHAEWQNNRAYYIKCRDLKGNEPSPNSCSIVVQSVNLGN